MRLDLVRKQMQYFFIHASGILTDMQEFLRIRLKTGYVLTILINLVFTAVIFMVRVFSHFKVMHCFIDADRYRVVFHSCITLGIYFD